MVRVAVVQDVLSWTALHWAASSGHVDAAKALLAAGANLTSTDVRGDVACAGAGTGCIAVSFASEW
jgi:ankyrin repeat protein